MLQESLASIRDQVGHQLESGVSTVVGIRHLGRFVFLAELGEGADLGAIFLRPGEDENFLAIEVVHGEDQVEGVKVARANFSRGTLYLDAALLESLAHSLIRGVACVSVDGAGRITLDGISMAALTEEMAKDIFASGGATNISPAHEENAKGILSRSGHVQDDGEWGSA